MLAPGDSAGYLRNYGDGEGRDERRGQVEQRLRLAVHTVKHLRLVIAEARRGLEPVHAQLRVDAVEYGHYARAESYRHTDCEDVAHYLPRGIDDLIVVGRVVCVHDACGIRRGKDVIVPPLVYHHVKQRYDRAYRNAKYRPCRADRAPKSGAHRKVRQNKAGNDLEQHLQHLVHRGGDHVAVALTVAAVGRDEAHKKYCRAHCLYAQRGVGVFKVFVRQPFREQEHYQREHQPYHEEGAQCHAEGLFLLLCPAICVRLRHKARQRHGQTGRRQSEEDEIYAVGTREHRVPLVAEDVAERDLIYKAQQLHYYHADGKDRRAAYIGLPISFCHCSPPLTGSWDAHYHIIQCTLG